MLYNIYLDDIRTPLESEMNWVVVRNYDEFCQKILELGLENIKNISLDHDLGPSAMQEWYTNVALNYTLNYNNITEKTGMDCIKWLVQLWKSGAPQVYVTTHSANAIGSANIMGYCNNYYHSVGLPQNCIRVRIPHTN